jgi:hypothetical protein
VGPTKKTAALLGHGLLPSASYNDSMLNFKDSPLNPTRPDSVVQKANKNALEDWNVEMEDAKLAFVCDCPFAKGGRLELFIMNR